MKAVFLDFNSLNQNDLEISRLQQQFDQLTLHAVTAPDEILSVYRMPMSLLPIKSE